MALYISGDHEYIETCLYISALHGLHLNCKGSDKIVCWLKTPALFATSTTGKCTNWHQRFILAIGLRWETHEQNMTKWRGEMAGELVMYAEGLMRQWAAGVSAGEQVDTGVRWPVLVVVLGWGKSEGASGGQVENGRVTGPWEVSSDWRLDSRFSPSL